jgi:hypothetical protein
VQLVYPQGLLVAPKDRAFVDRAAPRPTKGDWRTVSETTDDRQAIDAVPSLKIGLRATAISTRRPHEI